MTPSRAASLPLSGTWKMLSCETSHPHFPHPTASTTTFAERDGAVDYRAESVWSDGRATNVHAVFHLDGSWSAVEGSPLADSASLTALDNGAFEGRMKKGDAVAGSSHITVSADGRTTTTRWEIAWPGGDTVVWTTVSARQ
jgi:hypothetical protein